MNKKAPLPEQFSSTPEGIRRELISEINSKLPTWVFCWVLGILVPIFCGSVFYINGQVNSIKDNKLEDFQKRMEEIKRNADETAKINLPNIPT